MKRIPIAVASGLIALALASGAMAKPPRPTQEEQAATRAAEEAATAAMNAASADARTDDAPDGAQRAAVERECGKSPYALDMDAPPFPAPTQIDQPFGNAFLGAKDGKVRLVVFADYACEACRASQATLDRLVAEEPDLAVIYRFVPNDPGGEDPATLSLAIARTRTPVEWSAFHHAIDTGNSVQPEALTKALAAAGVKPQCYYTPGQRIFDNDASEEIARNNQLAVQRKLKAFPSWVISKGPVAVGIDYAALKAAIAKARAALY